MPEQQPQDAQQRTVKSYEMDGEKIAFEDPVKEQKAESLKAKRAVARNPLGAIVRFNCGPFSGKR